MADKEKKKKPKRIMHRDTGINTMTGNFDFDQDLDQYFESYEELDVHQLLLSDNSRILSYKNAIFDCKDKFKNKTVMDVGAGTGILSIFCAQAGSKKVYAVEASRLAEVAKEVVTENNFDEVIEVIERRIEDIEPNSIDKVDIIVSEWMGFYLVHEGMLDSVIVARDRFLKENGLLFPNVAKLYAAPCQLPSFFEFWENVCDVKMKCVGREHRRLKSLKPEVSIVKDQDLLSESKLLTWLDLCDTTLEELNSLGGEDTMTVCKKDGRYQGVCIWFAVEFPNGSELSTAPTSDPTHWKQTVVVLPNDIEVTENEPIAFKLSLNRDESKPRRYNMELTMLDAAEVEHDIPCNCDMTKCVVMRTYMKVHPMSCGDSTVTYQPHD